MLASRRVAQLAQRLGFDLTNPLAGYIELFTDFLEGVVGIHVDAETHAQNLGFTCREAGKHFACRFFKALNGGDIDWRLHGRVFDEVTQMGVFVITDRGFHGDRLFGDLQYLTDLVLRHFHAFTQIFRGRFATHFLQHLPGNTVELVDRLDHVHRNTDGACLVGDRASDRLTDPPGCIGRELVTATVFELVHRFHQADVAFLNQVEELQATVGVLLGDRDNQAQVGFNHLFLRAAGLGLADRHATVNVLDFRQGQLAFGFQGRQLLLAALDITLQVADGFGILGFAFRQATGPLGVDFIAWEQAQEIGTWHTRITYAKLHDGAFLSAQTLKRPTYADHQGLVLLGHQLDRHKQLGHFFQRGDALLAATAMLFKGFLGQVERVANRGEAAQGLFRIRTAVAFLFLVVAVVAVFFIVLVVSGVAILCRDGGGGFGGYDAVIRIDIATEHFNQAATFGGHTGVFAENAVDSAGEMSDSAHHLANAFLNPFGDFDLAFAGQQFHGAHFTHVHAHWVRRATDIGLHRCQRCSGFFSGCLVGIGVGQHKGVRIRSTLVYGDPHVVDHADDVFHLLRIRNIFRQVVVDLCVSQILLLTTQGDQLFDTRLLLRFSGHNTLSTEGG